MIKELALPNKIAPQKLATKSLSSFANFNASQAHENLPITQFLVKNPEHTFYFEAED